MKKSIILLSFIIASAAASCGGNHKGEEANQNKVEQEANNSTIKVKITTDLGAILLELYNETPVHRDNFVKLAEDGFYDGTLFHRVIREFMIQGGDPGSKGSPAGQPLGSGGPGYTLEAEILPQLFHKRGALAAARQGDQFNPERRSSGSQFYIVQGKVYTPEDLDMFENQSRRYFTPEQRAAYTTVGGTPHLDGAYTVFGQVLEGLDVVEKISQVQTAPGDRPMEDLTIKVEVLK